MKDQLNGMIFQSGMSILPQKIDMFLRHWQLLSDANQRFNLTAIEDENEAAEKHYLDSLLALPLLERLAASGAQLADLGSGGGFPGLPLAICRPDINFTLIEATGKKCDFLEHCASELGLNNVTVLKLRAEEAGREPDLRQSFDIVTARALAPLNVLLEYGLPLLKVGGRLLAYKGANVRQELEEAAHALAELGGEALELHQYRLPNSGEMRLIAEIEMVKKIGQKYPRRPGMPSKRPL